MKGTIIDFDEIEKSGLILAEDGNRYLFELNNWKSKNKIPEIDAEVLGRKEFSHRVHSHLDS